MDISVENVGTLGRRLTVRLPSDSIEQAYASRLGRMTQTARLPGFRPGKAPLKMIEARYGGQILQEVAGELVQSTWREAVQSQGLRPAADPSFEAGLPLRGTRYQYVAVFEVYPEFQARDLTGFRIERLKSGIGDQDIDRTVESLRQQRAWLDKVDRAAMNDDTVTVVMHGWYEDGQIRTTGEAPRPSRVQLGSGRGIQGLEDGLIGARAGERRQLDLTLPEGYRLGSLTGGAARFEVEVKEVAESRLPQVDAEFVRGFGIEDGDIGKLRAEIRKNLDREMQERLHIRMRDTVFGELLARNPVETPEGLVGPERDRLIAQRRDEQKSLGLSGDLSPEDLGAIAERAQRRIQLGLILAELVRSRGLSADPARVRARVERLATAYDDPQEFMQWHYAEPGRLNEIEAVVLEERAVEMLLETADIVEREIPFQELVVPAVSPGSQ